MGKKMPKWFTPERREALIELFFESKGFCVFGHKNCPYPEHHYQVFIEDLIKHWVAEDREAQKIEWDNLRRAMHCTNDRRFPPRGIFSGVSKDIFLDSQPVYYIEGIGVSGLTFKPFAKIRIASTFTRLYIELKLGKNAKRKAKRYGKLSEEAQRQVDKAVRHYLGSL